MNRIEFENNVKIMKADYDELIHRKNEKLSTKNRVYEKYKYPIITSDHTPLFWRYDFDFGSNPFLLERLGINATYNSGAIFLDGKYYLIVRVEGTDRKSFFAVAESPNGIDNFEFWDYPVYMPETDLPDTNIFDIRLVQHEDGWIYGLFSAERMDPHAKDGDTSSSISTCGIARTKDLIKWERLNDLKAKGPQHQNVTLHPKFVDGNYALYTQIQDDGRSPNGSGGIGWATTKSMNEAVIKNEKVIDPKIYYTNTERKNGLGPSPIKTSAGWLHLAHGVRNTTVGQRYVLYLFLTHLENPRKVFKKPGGYLISSGDSNYEDAQTNVIFSNGWIVNDDNEVFIYYASCDKQMHVATSTIDRLLDYVMNTPQDGYRSTTSVVKRNELIKKNLALFN
jgi:4-O-beta-D-mannosyl-D-glucose phosphorylase